MRTANDVFNPLNMQSRFSDALSRYMVRITEDLEAAMREFTTSEPVVVIPKISKVMLGAIDAQLAYLGYQDYTTVLNDDYSAHITFDLYKQVNLLETSPIGLNILDDLCTKVRISQARNPVDAQVVTVEIPAFTNREKLVSKLVAAAEHLWVDMYGYKTVEVSFEESKAKMSGIYTFKAEKE